LSEGKAGVLWGMNFTPASGSEADGAMQPGAIARGAKKPPAVAAWFQRMYLSFCF